MTGRTPSVKKSCTSNYKIEHGGLSLTQSNSMEKWPANQKSKVVVVAVTAAATVTIGNFI